MDKLTIYDKNGSALCTEELTSRGAVLMVVLRSGKPVVVDESAEGDEELAALMRNEDGWLMASPDPAELLHGGAKASHDMQLVPGVAVALKEFVFRLEGDSMLTGNVLVWQSGKSGYAADPVLAGRNVVARPPGGGAASVNPPLQGEVLFEFFPSVNGLEIASVAVDRGSRLVAQPETLFHCGEFHGMLMPAEEARKALATKTPFSYPSRGTRRALLVSLYGIAALLLGAALFHRLGNHYEYVLSTNRGAVELPASKLSFIHSASSDDDKLYVLAVLNSLPNVLKGEDVKTCDELIARGNQFKDKSRDIDVCLDFLESVRAIRLTIRSGRWTDLSAALTNAHDRSFVFADAKYYLNAARDVEAFVSRSYPQILTEVTEIGSKDIEKKLAAAREKVGHFAKENLFANVPVLKGEIDAFTRRVNLAMTYVRARAKVIAEGTAAKTVPAGDVTALENAFLDLKDELVDDAYRPLIDREKALLAAFAEKYVSEIVASTPADSPKRANLLAAVSLGDTCGLDEAKTKAWRKEAREGMKMLESRYQELYQQYRLAGDSLPDHGLSLLKRIVALSEVEGPFRTWALREEEKIEKTKGGRAK